MSEIAGNGHDAEIAVSIEPMVEIVRRVRRARTRGKPRVSAKEARRRAAQAERSKKSRAKKKNELVTLRTMVAALPPDETPLEGEVLPPERHMPARDAQGSSPVAPHHASRDATPARLWRIKLFACFQPTVLVCFLLFVACAAVGLAANALSLWSLGVTWSAGFVFAVVALIADVIVLFGLVIIKNLWRDGEYVLATGLVVVCVAMLIFAGSNSLSFTTQNIDDSVAGRAQAIQRYADTDALIKRKREDRAKLGTVPHVSETTLALARSRVSLQCPENKIGAPCIALMNKTDGLSRDHDLTQKADKLDGEIRELQGQLDGMRAVKSADPLVEGVRRIGIPSEWAVTGRMLIVAGVTLLGGLCLACCKALWEARVARAMGMRP